MNWWPVIAFAVIALTAVVIALCSNRAGKDYDRTYDNEAEE